MRIALSLALTLITALPSASAADLAAVKNNARSGKFDATGMAQCAQEVGQPLGICDAEVAREEGSAAVVVTFKNGFARTLMFSDGAFLRGNATMSGVGTDMDWRLSGGLYHIRVDDQRFEIPETLVTGG